MLLSGFFPSFHAEAQDCQRFNVEPNPAMGTFRLAAALPTPENLRLPSYVPIYLRLCRVPRYSAAGASERKSYAQIYTNLPL